MDAFKLRDDVIGDYSGTYEGQTLAQANKRQCPRFDSTQHAEPELLVKPRYWVDQTEAEMRLAGRWDRDWLLGWRDICRSTDMRTVIAGVIPRVACGDTFLLAFPQSHHRTLLGAALSSFAVDFVARQKIGGTHLKYHSFKQVAVLPPERLAEGRTWSTGSVPSSLQARVLELTYTAWDLEGFARDLVGETASTTEETGLVAYVDRYVGNRGVSSVPLPPFRWDEARRATLRAELDAAFFHLYLPSDTRGDWIPARAADGGVRDETVEELAELRNHFPTPRDAVDYIMDTFPIVKRKDEAAFGEYRTKRLILEAYDAMQTAMVTGVAYESPLDPPAAHPSQAHDVSTRPNWMGEL